MNYLELDHTIEERVNIGGIPSIIFKPRNSSGLLPTVIHYHGWSSDKENQKLRAYMVASFGYQLVVPDAINHGERNPLDDYGPENAVEYFWKTVFTNLEESDQLIEELVENHRADPDRIGIMGHSMGGITGAGVFTHNPRIKALVVLNGACGWDNFNEILKEMFSEKIEMEEVEEKIRSLDPIGNLDLLKDRSMILLHGDADEVIPIGTQEFFYEKARINYSDKRKIKIIKYLHGNHDVSVNMMEGAISWLQKHL